MLHILPPTFNPVLQQISLLPVAESCCRKERVALYFLKQNLYILRVLPVKDKLFLQQLRHNFRASHVSRVILFNQKSVFTQLAVTFICCKTGFNVGT